MKTGAQTPSLFCWPIVALLCCACNMSGQGLEKNGYRVLEAYSAGDGLILIPSHSSDGTICDISIQRNAFSGGIAETDLSMASSDVDRVLSKLVPQGERGREINANKGALKLIVGNAVAAVSQYKYMTITRYSTSTGHKSDLAVVTIHYKRRACGDQ